MNANANVNAASGLLHEPIGAIADANAIEQTETLTFVHKFGARKICDIRMDFRKSHAVCRTIWKLSYSFPCRFLLFSALIVCVINQN